MSWGFGIRGLKEVQIVEAERQSRANQRESRQRWVPKALLLYSAAYSAYTAAQQEDGCVMWLSYILCTEILWTLLRAGIWLKHFNPLFDSSRPGCRQQGSFSGFNLRWCCVNLFSVICSQVLCQSNTHMRKSSEGFRYSFINCNHCSEHQRCYNLYNYNHWITWQQFIPVSLHHSCSHFTIDSLGFTIDRSNHLAVTPES